MFGKLLHGPISTAKYWLASYLNLALRLSCGVFDLTLHLVVGVKIGISSSNNNNNSKLLSILGRQDNTTFKQLRSIFVFSQSTLMRGLIGLPDGGDVKAGEAARDSKYCVKEVDQESVCLAKKKEAEIEKSSWFAVPIEAVLSRVSRVAVSTLGGRREIPGDRVMLGSLVAFCDAVEEEWRAALRCDWSTPQILLLSSLSDSDDSLPLLKRAADVPGAVVVEAADVDGVAAVLNAFARGVVLSDMVSRAVAAMIMRQLCFISKKCDHKVGRVVVILPALIELEEAIESEIRCYTSAVRRIYLEPRQHRRVVHVQRQWLSNCNSDY